MLNLEKLFNSIGGIATPQNNLRLKIKRYLEELYGAEVNITYLGPIKKDQEYDEGLKEFGYGQTILIEFNVNGVAKSYVMSSMTKNIFGHEHFSDRAQSLLLAHSTFNKLPRHVSSIDVGVYTERGSLKSVGDAKEFFIITEKVDGEEYFLDLERIKNEGNLTELDVNRANTLAEYLVDIHSVKNDEKSLYTRRIRELIGHGECLMGLTDSYPEKLDFTDYNELKEIEKKCVDWRYKIKNRTERLCQVHGDFHPWNILFRDGTDFTVLDRSRGEWGEAADDVASMTINYLFYALQKHGKIEGVFYRLFKIFWETYLSKSNDEEILSVIAPFYAWRCLVIASPIWYPKLDRNIRRKIFNFMHNVLDQEVFNIDSTPKMFEEY
ncbi:MAG: phosphotransferase family protein [Candidatus Odinarchaeia archaeon]